ncbi:MBL fold metallo-hydrolase [Chitinophaga sp.]|uniref:MBL fold metallo-hydrolase n=1 Tax=Chitinophaga sp. TaxID=1869181 RepID=UPI0031D2FD9B
MTRVIVFLATCLFPFYNCAPVHKQIVSDHYDGKKFYNPTLAKQFSPGLSDIIRMMREGRPKWPEKVATNGIHKLDEDLGTDGISLTFVNHATFLIQLPGINILTDPVWAKRVSPVSWFGPMRVRTPGIKMEELPVIHLVIISHNHYDHLDLETLKKLGKRFSPKVLVPVGDKALVESVGIKDVQELDWWESVQLNPDTRITFTPAQHSSRRGLLDKDRSLWGSYFIQSNKHSVYFGGDAGYSTHYKEIKKRLGAPEFALLGIGVYEPNWFMKPMHMNPAEAVAAYMDLDAKLGIGMHFGTFQLASEEYDQPQKELKAALEKMKISQDRFITLQEGETKYIGR